MLQCKAFLFSTHISIKSVVLMNALCEWFEVSMEAGGGRRGRITESFKLCF